jgi:hypothetical protein
VVVKGTFAFPERGQTPELAAQQADLVMSDEFTGEPAYSVGGNALKTIAAMLEQSYVAARE